MDFSDRELKLILQALYKLRSEAAGGTQAERNKLESVVKVVERIEAKIGPLRGETTSFDREMEASLAVLKTGRAGVASAAAKKTAPKAAAPKTAAPKTATPTATAKAAGAKAAKATKAPAKKTTTTKAAKAATTSRGTSAAKK